jgi:molybdopterin biosynthesis enzyme
MGEMDLIKPYLESAGRVLFGRLNMKPGKPTTFGVLNSKLIFALPGNPVSSYVTASLFLPFALGCMMGAQPRLPAMVSV